MFSKYALSCSVVDMNDGVLNDKYNKIVEINEERESLPTAMLVSPMRYIK